MLEKLKFAIEAVEVNSAFPFASNFKISGGYLRAFNGTLAITCPFPVNLDCCPDAAKLLAAIKLCGDDCTFALGQSKLLIKSGKRRVYVPVVEDVPVVEPSGVKTAIDGEALKSAFQAVLPFIGTDNLRPWSTGALVGKGSIFATNNVCVVQAWHAQMLPTVNLPRSFVKIVVEREDSPVDCCCDERSLTLSYGDGGWVRTQLLECNWPDLGAILDVKSSASEVDSEILQALNFIEKVDGSSTTVFFNGDEISSSQHRDDGSAYKIDGLDLQGAYQLAMLKLVLKNCERIDFTSYPKPAMFFRGNLRGALAGVLRK